MSSNYWFPAFGDDAGRLLIQEVFDRDEARTQTGKKDTEDPLKSFSLIFWTLISASGIEAAFVLSSIEAPGTHSSAPTPKKLIWVGG